MIAATERPVAVVTGGSGTIGGAVAARLARSMDVVVTARGAARLQEAARAIARDAGATVTAHPSDACDQRSIDTLVEFVAARFGRLDALINCAAGTASVAGGVERLDVDLLVGDLDVKVGGYLRYARAAVPMLKRRGGAIVNVGGLTGRATDTLSGMRNVAVSHLTKVLADQLGPAGVVVNAVHPGIIDTAHLTEVVEERAAARGVEPDEIRAALLAEIPLRRFLSVDQIAEVIAMLAMPGMTSISGQSITVDAGYSRGVYL